MGDLDVEHLAQDWHPLSTPSGEFLWSSSLYSCALCAHGIMFLVEFSPQRNQQENPSKSRILILPQEHPGSTYNPSWTARALKMVLLGDSCWQRQL